MPNKNQDIIIKLNEIRNKKAKIISKEKFTKRVVLAIFIIILLLSVILSNHLINILIKFNKYLPIVIIILMMSIMFIVGITIKWGVNEEDEKKYQIIISILTLLVLFGQLVIYSYQADIMKTQSTILEKQTEILEKTSQLNNPNVFIYSKDGYRAYRLSQISESYNDIGVGVTNLGKATAQYIEVSLEPNMFIGKQSESYQPYSPFFYIINLNSLDYNDTRFEFWVNPSISNNLTIGEKNITFKLTCPLCIDPIKYQNITICVYNNSPSECGEKWRYAW